MAKRVKNESLCSVPFLWHNEIAVIVSIHSSGHWVEPALDCTSHSFTIPSSALQDKFIIALSMETSVPPTLANFNAVSLPFTRSTALPDTCSLPYDPPPYKSVDFHCPWNPRAIAYMPNKSLAATAPPSQPHTEHGLPSNEVLKAGAISAGHQVRFSFMSAEPCLWKGPAAAPSVEIKGAQLYATT